MSRAVVATVAVAFLVVTAGCGAVSQGGDSRDPYGVPATETDRPTATAPEVRAPPEILATLLDQRRKLGRVDNYTLQFDRTVSVAGEVGNFRNETYRVDAVADRGSYFLRFLRGQRTGLSTVSVYRGDGVFRAKRTPPLGDDARFSTLVDPANSPANESLSLLQVESHALESVALERNGTATFEGERMRRYTANGVDSFSGWTGNLSSYRIVVLVDSRGLVRSIDERRVRVSRGGVRFLVRERMLLTDVGTTSVSRPEWVGNATTTGE